MEPNLEIVVGTYEDFIAGYKVELGKESDEGNTNMFQSFSDRAHSGSVRSIDSSIDGRLVASAGIDENIHVFDLKKRMEISQIRSDNDGAINCVKFFDKSHLFAGSEDGNIYIYDCRQSFKLVKTLQGHKKGVTWLSVHPSGKILLSVSKDGTLRTWNLIKGRCAYVTNLKLTSHFVSWSISGAYFLIAVNNTIDVYNVADGSISHTVTFDKRVNYVEFLTEHIVAVAKDSPLLDFYDLSAKKTLLQCESHINRIKAIKIVHNDDQDDSTGVDEKKKQFITISSDSTIKLWSVSIGNKEDSIEMPQLVATTDTGARLTCLTFSLLKV